MPTDGHNVLMLRIHLTEPIAQAPHQRVNGLFADAVPDDFWPNASDDFITGADAPAILIQQLKQAILGQAERGADLDAVDEHTPRIGVDLESFVVVVWEDAGEIVGDRCSDARPDKAHAHGQREENFIPIAEWARPSSLTPFTHVPFLLFRSSIK